MKISYLLLFTAAFGAASGVDQSALAYLDPGTGSMIIQLILGGFVGLAVIGKLYWHRLKAIFTRDSGLEANDAHERPDRN